MKKITIAIDGHSSCGKSTMAKDLAREVGYVYVDTGAMYRCVTLYALRHGIFTPDGINEDALRQAMSDIQISFRFNAEKGRPDTYLNGELVGEWAYGYNTFRVDISGTMKTGDNVISERWFSLMLSLRFLLPLLQRCAPNVAMTS